MEAFFSTGGKAENAVDERNPGRLGHLGGFPLQGGCQPGNIPCQFYLLCVSGSVWTKHRGSDGCFALDQCSSLTC